MARPLYYCAFRTASSGDTGLHPVPGGCSNNESDRFVRQHGIQGSCIGVFSTWPVCRSFVPTRETAAGRLYWLRKKAKPEKPMALPVNSLFRDPQPHITNHISDAAIISVLHKVRVAREEILEIIS